MNTVVQLAPPNIHRRNLAERVILTSKNHFVDGLDLMEKNFLFICVVV